MAGAPYETGWVPDGFLMSVTEGKDSSRVRPLEPIGYLITVEKAEKNIKYIVEEEIENLKEALSFFNGEKRVKKRSTKKKSAKEMGTLKAFLG